MDELTERELGRKFSRTYVAVKDTLNGLEYLCFVQGIGGGQLDGYFIVKPTTFITESTKVKATRTTLPLKNLEFLPIPDSSVYDVNGHTQVFEHRPARQWRVGVCGDNSRTQSPIYSLLEEAFKEIYNNVLWYANSFETGSYGNFLHLFFPNHTNKISTAISIIKEKGLYSKTINNKWFVSLGYEEDEYFLFFKDLSVALINTKNNNINVYQKLFYQEVIDLVQRTGDKYYVR